MFDIVILGCCQAHAVALLPLQTSLLQKLSPFVRFAILYKHVFVHPSGRRLPRVPYVKIGSNVDWVGNDAANICKIMSKSRVITQMELQRSNTPHRLHPAQKMQGGLRRTWAPRCNLLPFADLSGSDSGIQRILQPNLRFEDAEVPP